MLDCHELSQEKKVLALGLVFWIQQALGHDYGVVFDRFTESFVEFLQVNKEGLLGVWKINWDQSGIHQTVTRERENIGYKILLIFYFRVFGH
jgi:hypothetical protein